MYHKAGARNKLTSRTSAFAYRYVSDKAVENLNTSARIYEQKGEQSVGIGEDISRALA